MSEAKVVDLYGRSIDPDEIDPGIISMLEQWLEDARAGRIKGIAGVVTHSDGATATFWSDAKEFQIKMVGAISVLKHRYMSQLEITGLH